MLLADVKQWCRYWSNIHEVNLVLGSSRRHVGLLEVWCHGSVVGKLVEKRLGLLGVESPFARGIGRNGNLREVSGEVLSGGDVWVHWCEVE